MSKTTYKIIDSSAGRTIIFYNLYLINGEFVFNGFVEKSDISTYPNVHYRHTNFQLWAPSIRELNDTEEIPILAVPHFYFKESVHGHPIHTLLDDVFSVFYSLYRCKISNNPCISIIEMTNEYNWIDFYDFKGIFESLFGQKAISFHYLTKLYPKICFETFIVGNADSGVHSYDADYASPFQDEILKQFRNAFYNNLNINFELPEKIIYANNNNYPIQKDLKDFLISNNIDIIEWGATKHISDKLNILKNVKIFIATEGSNAMNAIFLPDNAIIIDLGRIYANGNYKVLGYCVDFLFPALSYIDVFYFEDYYTNYHNTIETNPNPDELISMIKELSIQKENSSFFMKRKEIYTNFALKVMNKIHYLIKIVNYSPNTRLLLENFPNKDDRVKITEDFKQGNIGFACNEKIRPFRKIMELYNEKNS